MSQPEKLLFYRQIMYKMRVMKTLLGIMMCLVFVLNSFASPLVFKVSKEIDSTDFVELATLDTAKYKQLRIGIKFINPASEEARRQIDKLKKDLDEGKINRQFYEASISQANERIKIGEIQTFSLEDGQEIYLTDTGYSMLIDSPPSKILVKVKGQGKFMLYVWASV